MIFGADYYPEHWDRSEWQHQAHIMSAAHINTVRIAEFAWKRLEPQEDFFDFSWLDDVIDVLAEKGIKVILGTPTATPPKWLVNKYDILQRDKYGRARDFGSRRECCANNPYYRKRCEIIVKEMAKRYGKNPNVAAWQIDNEFGCHNSTRCYCAHCRHEFSQWLKKRYIAIRNLNSVYGTVFWSQEYDSFDDVILPAYNSCEGTYGDTPSHNPSLELDFYRFSSDTWIKFAEDTAKLIRVYSDKPITHNLMGHFSDIDYYKFGKVLDVTAWDNYPDTQWGHSSYEETSMAHELMRGVKDENFWVMEEQAGPCGWDKFGETPRPGQLRLWTYQAIAHGCEGLLYFRFRSVPYGMEQYWMGIVDHDGIPRRRFYEVSRTGTELAKLGDVFVGAENLTDVLIVKSYEQVWSHQIKSHVKGFDYRTLLYDYYKANNHLGTNPACGGEDMISDKYKVIYMPAYIMVSYDIKEKLQEYVSKGGVLVLTFFSGVKDSNNNMTTKTLPGFLSKLAGINVVEFDSSNVKTELSDNYGTAGLWRDIIEPVTARTEITYESEYYAGTPAVTVNDYGEGKVWYIGCDMEEESLKRLIEKISADAGAEVIPQPKGGEVVRRRNGDREFYMLLNYEAKEKKFDIVGKSLFTGKKFNGVLEPYGVEVVEI